MRYSLWMVPTLLAALVASSASAQVPPKRSLEARGPSALLLVVTPDTAPAVPFDHAVELAAGIRRQLERTSMPEYAVVSRASTNRALEQYGYSPDAILSPAAAEALAAALHAKAVVIGTMERVGESYRVVARLGGPGGKAGRRVNLTQAEGQSLSDLGLAIADRLRSQLP